MKSIIKSKTMKVASLAVVAALAVASGAQASTIIGSLTVSGNVALGSTVTLSGSCGIEQAGATVNFSLVSQNSTMSLGSTTVNAQGNFASSVTIPANAPAGPATLVAECPNGKLVASVTVIDPAAVSLTVANPNPAIGGVIHFHGVCPGNAGQSVDISIMQNGSTVLIGKVITTAGGAFSGVLTIPHNVFVAGSATLMAECPNGSVATAGINLTPAVVVQTPPPVIITPAPVVIADTTPVGGVAAGTGAGTALGWMLVAGAAGLAAYAYAYSRKPGWNS